MKNFGTRYARSGGMDKTPIPLAKKLGAEALGAFALTFAGAFIDILARIHPEDVSLTARAACPALVIMASIFTLGSISGAHFNPIVTVTFWLQRVFPGKFVPFYLLAEISGALLAGLLLNTFFSDSFSAAVNQPHTTPAIAWMSEISLSFLLIVTILGTAKQHSLLGAEAAIPVGGYLFAAHILGTKLSGPSLNPARSLGTAIVEGNLEHLSLYLLGPFLGALLAIAVIALIHVPRKKEEAEAANGNT